MMMIGTKIKIMALSIAAMISLLGLGGAAAASGLTDLTLFVNEHVSLSASPGTTGGSYYYMWTPSLPITENGLAVNTLVSQNPLVFDAPSTAGDYTLKVLVTDINAPANCKAETTINIHVKDCCPLIEANYCVEDKPTWCWYDSCGIPTKWAYPWVVDPSSIVFNWYVPSTATGTPVTGACYSPSLKALPFTIPNAGTPTQSNSVRLDVTQTTSAHGGTSITLYSCTKTFDLHWVPVPSIGLTT
jgi:hypothetical protein